jgi:hypothetical protein
MLQFLPYQDEPLCQALKHLPDQPVCPSCTTISMLVDCSRSQDASAGGTSLRCPSERQTFADARDFALETLPLLTPHTACPPDLKDLKPVRQISFVCQRSRPSLSYRASMGKILFPYVLNKRNRRGLPCGSLFLSQRPPVVEHDVALALSARTNPVEVDDVLRHTSTPISVTVTPFTSTCPA